MRLSSNPSPFPALMLCLALAPACGGEKEGGVQEPDAPSRENREPRPDPAARMARRVLSRLSKVGPEGVKGTILAWERRNPEGKVLRRMRACLRFPDKLRLETEREGRPTSLAFLDGKRLLVGRAGGPYQEASDKRMEEVRWTLLLLGSLLGWDLHPEKDLASGEAGLLESRASWWGGVEAPRVRRKLSKDAGVEVLSLGKERFRLSGSLQVPLGEIADRLSLPGRKGELRFTQFLPRSVFKKGFFDPSRQDGKGEISLGREPRPRKPVLRKLQAAQEIAWKDPGSWPERIRLLQEKGRELQRLGYRADPSLPFFTSDGRILLHVRPAGREASPLPKEMGARNRPARMSAVVFVECLWEEAEEALRERLLGYLERRELKALGPLWMSPFLDFGQRDPAPRKGQRITVRGEIRVQ